MEKQLGLGTGRLEEKETRTNVEDTTSVGLFCYVLRTSFLLSTLSLVCTGEGAGGVAEHTVPTVYTMTTTH